MIWLRMGQLGWQQDFAVASSCVCLRGLFGVGISEVAAFWILVALGFRRDFRCLMSGLWLTFGFRLAFRISNWLSDFIAAIEFQLFFRIAIVLLDCSLVV